MIVVATRVLGDSLPPDVYQCARCGRTNIFNQYRTKPTHCRDCTDVPNQLGTSPLSWAEDALCAQVGSEPFFPDPGGANRAAKAVCAACPARVACLAYAMGSPELLGVWGGLSAHERKQIRAGREVA